MNTPKEVSRQRRYGKAIESAQEREPRNGENVHSEVLRSMARLGQTFSEPRSTRSVYSQSSSGQRPVRRRPSTVHTPEFRDMIARMSLDSANAIRDRTAGRLQRLGSSTSSDIGEDRLSDKNEVGDQELREEREEAEFIMIGETSHQEHVTYEDNSKHRVYSHGASDSGESSVSRQYEDANTVPRFEDEFRSSSAGNKEFYDGYNSQKGTPTTKYYAVRRGRKPGIYRSWEDCERQVEGFSYCVFKSFKTELEAQQYLASEPPQLMKKEHDMAVGDMSVKHEPLIYQKDGHVPVDRPHERNDAVYPPQQGRHIHVGLFSQKGQDSQMSVNPDSSVQHPTAASTRRGDGSNGVPSHPNVGQTTRHEFERTYHRGQVIYPQEMTVMPDMSVDRDNIQIGTIQRRNITHRRSQGRARDRNSIGQPSLPVESLLARKPQPRGIDVEYKKEARTPTTPPPPPSFRAETQSSYHADIAPPMPLQDPNDPPIPADLFRCWRDKIAIEEAMTTALNEGNDTKYQYWVAQQHKISDQIYHLLCPASQLVGSGYSGMPITPPDMGRVEHPNNQDDRSSTTDTEKDWHFQGSSFVISLETPDTVVPWVVWNSMPVSLLLQAGCSLLAQPNRVIDPACVSLLHHGLVMDAVNGYLSDYNVLNNDVITVQLTVMRGGLVSDRNTPRNERTERTSGRQTSKPQPTIEPHEQFHYRRNEQDNNKDGGMDNRSYEKLKQTFKCPKFTGSAKDWKLWNKGFQRYLSIWELDHVLDPDFFNEVPLSKGKVRDNKFVYYLLEDATQNSPLASSYVRQAPAENGFEAFYTLHDGYVFAGSTASTLLLNELSNFRFKSNESPTELILRLEELFQDLEMLPNEAALTFNDTQKIGYLLGALRHESQWAAVASAITSDQLKGRTSFKQACEELKVRCEASKAYDLMDKQAINRRKVPGHVASVVPGDTTEKSNDGVAVEEEIKAFISSMSKRLNQSSDPQHPGNNQGRRKKKGKKTYELRECSAKDCKAQTTFPLCGLCFHSLVSGKTTSVELVNGWGKAEFSTETNRVVYPPGMPSDLIPKPKKQQ
jgi:hypothetical protein